MIILRIILSVFLLGGAALFILCSILCAIAPDFVNRYELKEWTLKIGSILVLVGLIGILIQSK